MVVTLSQVVVGIGGVVVVVVVTVAVIPICLVSPKEFSTVPVAGKAPFSQHDVCRCASTLPRDTCRGDTTSQDHASTHRVWRCESAHLSHSLSSPFTAATPPYSSHVVDSARRRRLFSHNLVSALVSSSHHVIDGAKTAASLLTTLFSPRYRRR